MHNGQQAKTLQITRRMNKTAGVSQLSVQQLLQLPAQWRFLVLWPGVKGLMKEQSNLSGCYLEGAHIISSCELDKHFGHASSQDSTTSIRLRVHMKGIQTIVYDSRGVKISLKVHSCVRVKMKPRLWSIYRSSQSTYTFVPGDSRLWSRSTKNHPVIDLRNM